MKRLTERDEFGNANIIGVDSADLQLNLDFEEFNRVTEALNKLADCEDTEVERDRPDAPKVVRCVECRHGKPHTVVGDGINEPPYIEKTKCDTGLKMQPGDYCSYEERCD